MECWDIHFTALDHHKYLSKGFPITRSRCFRAEPLGKITRIEIQTYNSGKRKTDWYLSEVIVLDPQSNYSKYIFSCSQWIKCDGGTGVHYLVAPSDQHTSYFRMFSMSILRGFSCCHLWLASLLHNGQSMQFNGCTAVVLIYQLLCNLLLLNTAPTDLSNFTCSLLNAIPLNMVAFLVTFIIEIVTRNIKPRIVCFCPFHHDWDEEKVAYRTAVRIEVAQNPVNLEPSVTYDSLVRCLTEDDWRQAKEIARDAWNRISGDSISEEDVDDLIKTFLYRMAQKIAKDGKLEDEITGCRDSYSSLESDSWSSSFSSVSVMNMNQSAVDFYQSAMGHVKANMEGGLAEMVREKTNRRLGKEQGAYQETVQSCDVPFSNASRIQNLHVSSSEVHMEYEIDEMEPLVKGDLAKYNKNTNASEISTGTFSKNYGLATVIYRVINKEFVKERILLTSDLEFIVKSQNGESISCIRLHNSLSQVLTYELQSSNSASYEIQPKTGLIKPHSTAVISVWLLRGRVIKEQDRITITALPVEEYRGHPYQTHWVWKKKSNESLKYVLRCKGIFTAKIQEPLELTMEHLIQLELEMAGEHTKYLVPWTIHVIYIFCIMQGTIALIWTCYNEINKGKNDNYNWLQILGVAILEHIFVFEFIKILFITIGSILLKQQLTFI